MNTKIAKGIALLAMALLGAIPVSSAFAGDEAAAAPSLYERLGASEGIGNIVRDTVALHHKNPAISHYFSDVNDDQLVTHVAAFFTAGTGGPANYQGRDMTSAHAAMQMSDADFDSAVADVMTALRANGVAADAQSEVAAILESLRPAVMGTSSP